MDAQLETSMALPTRSPSLFMLPPEIRTMIWTMTLPERRLFEAKLCYEGSSWPGPILHQQTLLLRCLGSPDGRTLSSLYASGDEWALAAATCPNPVTLYVCAESRALTLQKYVRLRAGNLHDDASRTRRAVYCDPARDAIWFSDVRELTLPNTVGFSALDYSRLYQSIREDLLSSPRWAAQTQPFTRAVILASQWLYTSDDWDIYSCMLRILLPGLETVDVVLNRQHRTFADQIMRTINERETRIGPMVSNSEQRFADLRYVDVDFNAYPPATHRTPGSS